MNCGGVIVFSRDSPRADKYFKGFYGAKKAEKVWSITSYHQLLTIYFSLNRQLRKDKSNWLLCASQFLSDTFQHEIQCLQMLNSTTGLL